MNTVHEYFDKHPEARDDVWKATQAYHIPHFRMDGGAHNFSGFHRDAECVWCGRSRELVRWDDLPPECQNRPAWADVPIDDTILGEEQKFFALLTRAEKEVPKLIERHGMSGETLALLHHTHGYDPETVSGVVNVPAELLAEYNDRMERERAMSRAAQVKEIIRIAA